MKYWIIAGLLLGVNLSALAQQEGQAISGRVFATEADGKINLFSVNVYWLGTTVGTSSDMDGKFSIQPVKETTMLVFSSVGYQSDTIDTRDKKELTVELKASVELKAAEVVQRKKSTEISYLNPLKVENVGEKELLKAACCNLAESFETSPSVDVAFTDAVTGTRQIQMLGLAGPYTQISRENMPSIRGFSAIYGLTFVPGTWIQGIQLNKGAGSVVNGYESIAGQINVELRKPEEADRVYLNLYANEGGRVEANANFAHRFKNKKWSTALLLHGKNNNIKHDRNNDGFLDMPLGKHYIGLNRWKYIGPNGLRTQFAVKGTYVDNLGGQKDFKEENRETPEGLWGMKMKIQRLEAWAKIGKVYEDKPWKSIGLQLSGAGHEQGSYFGRNNYFAEQQTFYANTLYQGIFNNTNHKFRTGVSWQYDNYDERLNDTSYSRVESVPGAYFEYTYSNKDKFSAVLGLRADHHNYFGGFVTPRMHLRYALTENTVLRASAGRGQRTANVLSDNNGLLASSRQIIIQRDGSDKPYGLDAEVAWNYGLNLVQTFTLDYRDGSIGVDFYRTQFTNQIVTDLDQSAQKVVFYNLDGKSYSNSFQIQLDYEAIKRLDVRLAYRWFDVKTTYHGKLLEKPLIAAHRAFINLAYETRKNWKFDYTLNWQGEKRIPYTGDKPGAYRLPERSPSFFLMNAQITKSWKEQFEVYVGVENLLDFRQDNPIVASAHPDSPYFDSSMIWGPIFGRNTYIGLRYKLK